ncbi:MAG: hypothetical protein WBA54_13955 [Acidaminobacteraceae bacterium]
MNIAFLGNLGNVSYKMCKAINLNSDYKAFLLLSESETRNMRVGNPLWEDRNSKENDWIIQPTIDGISRYSGYRRIIQYIRTVLDMKYKMKKYDYVFASTMNSIWAFFSGVEYYSMTTGADITELAFEKSIFGFFYRKSLFKAQKVFLLNTNQIKFAEKLKLKNFVYLPFSIDTSKYFCSINKQSSKLRILHSCRLDWIDETRTSIKKNDIFFKGFAKFYNENEKYVDENIELIVFKFGTEENINATIQLNKDLGIDNVIKYIEVCDKDLLIEEYSKSDVVIDQFSLGAFGLNFLEAMSCENILITYLDTDDIKKCYDKSPPIFNSKTSDEVCNSIRSIVEFSNEEVEKMKKESRQWIIENHDDNEVVKIIKIMIEEENLSEK